MTKELKTAVRGSGRVGFLARLDEIKKMIEAGHPLLIVYQKHESDLSISYSQFVKYVNKFIRGNKAEKQKNEIQEKRKEKSSGKSLVTRAPVNKEDIV